MKQLIFLTIHQNILHYLRMRIANPLLAKEIPFLLELDAYHAHQNLAKKLHLAQNSFADMVIATVLVIGVVVLLQTLLKKLPKSFECLHFLFKTCQNVLIYTRMNMLYIC